MNPGEELEKTYKWLRSCGYSHDAAINALKERDKRPAVEQPREVQPELFASQEKGKTL